MSKLIPFLLGSALLVSLAACSPARTSTSAPDSTDRQGEVPSVEDTQQAQNDANSEVRQKQIASDERARAQRNQAAGNPAERADSDLESLVRNQLEKNLPASNLTIDAEEGAVTISGTVTDQNQLSQVAPLAQSVQGVKSVDVKATVASPTP